ncbi:MAG TPA: acylphosphatase [Gammaproteobacteria bacterium]|nr:acylphosphatase [Gammaproteobacteria bacterium]
MKVCKRCLVTGRVQGVFYRASAAEHAQQLGITGYARNLPDGRVEVLACGEQASVGVFCEWLRKGPPAAKVSGVEIIETGCDPMPVGFNIH